MNESCSRIPWWVMAVALLMPGLGALIYFVGAREAEEARWSYAATKGFLLAWPLISVRWLLPPRGKTKAVRREIWTSIWVGLLLGGGIVLLMVGLFASPVGDWIRTGEEAILAKLTQFGVERHFLLTAIYISLLHSAVEEYYWRWFVYGQLRRLLSRWTAHGLAAVGFSLHHYVVLGQYFDLGITLWLGTMVGVGGFLWSWMYERWGSLWGPWLSHVLADLGIFWVAYQLLIARG